MTATRDKGHRLASGFNIVLGYIKAQPHAWHTSVTATEWSLLERYNGEIVLLVGRARESSGCTGWCNWLQHARLTCYRDGVDEELIIRVVMNRKSMKHSASHLKVDSRTEGC